MPEPDMALIAIPEAEWNRFRLAVSALIKSIPAGDTDIPGEKIQAVREAHKRAEAQRLMVYARPANEFGDQPGTERRALVATRELTLSYAEFVATFGEVIPPLYPTWVTATNEPGFCTLDTDPHRDPETDIEDLDGGADREADE